jgi:hypothetical protein
MARKVAALLVVLGVVALILPTERSVAQESVPQNTRRLQAGDVSTIYDDTQAPSDQDLELFKRDVRSEKKQIIAANMDLTDDEAEKFWPVYDRYAAELAKIYDTKMALIEDYVQNSTTLSGDEAESYIRRRAAVEQDVMQLRLKYLPAFRKVLSGRQTALFFQIDYRLDLIINMQLAQAPLIDP